MKKTYKQIMIAGCLGMAVLATGCSDWLTPKPLSFFTPELTYTNWQGIKSGSEILNRDIRYFDFFPTAFSADPAILSEYFFSDMAVNGRTDASNAPMDLKRQITPSANLNGNASQINSYWNNLYKGIKDANTLISRSEGVVFESEEQKQEIMASLYFHRAYRYYRLVHQYGDVPFIVAEITEPRFNFYTTKREAILRFLKNDLDKSVQHMKNNVLIGQVTQAAAYHLLTKINLALGEFEDAVASSSAVINNGYHHLMTNRFGVDKDDSSKDVVWDLHQTANKRLPENRELLYVVLDDFFNTEARSATGLEIKRQVLPMYTATSNVKTPAGEAGFIDNDEKKNPYLKEYGRGIATLRSTWYHQNMIWTLDDTDYRHKQGNWMHLSDLKYNNPGLKNKEWFGKPVQMYDDKGKLLVTDTIRVWCGWPHYKTNIADQKEKNWRGGWADWYVFRLAETYLLRAEAYYWLNKKDQAVEDLNAVRQRAGARLLTSNEVTMRQILDERARELFYEEPRKCELTRIAYIYAQTGIQADNGKTYSLENIGTDNFFYDHIMSVTDFYNKGVKAKNGNEYTMAPHHIHWPIALSATSVNVQGHINQAPGYDGSENNIPPLDTPYQY
ncbi:MAG: RagB/SusD family nutrient uptake outer membrane protein [Bacteroidales bacterium]